MNELLPGGYINHKDLLTFELSNSRRVVLSTCPLAAAQKVKRRASRRDERKDKRWLVDQVKIDSVLALKRQTSFLG